MALFPFNINTNISRSRDISIINTILFTIKKRNLHKHIWTTTIVQQINEHGANALQTDKKIQTLHLLRLAELELQKRQFSYRSDPVATSILDLRLSKIRTLIEEMRTLI